MNLSLDFIGCLPGDVGLRRAAIHGGPGTAMRRLLLLAREDDLDAAGARTAVGRRLRADAEAAVARTAVGRRIRVDRVLRAVARGREAAGSDVVADEESDDSRRAGGRELSLRRERRARHRQAG